mmetsp:Transcript_133681/g.303191  ORF Transcript_133681/g.303191 Transcript_133681/m.303191 type:complete len:391 (-) Transcript_133681:259-1431(-)
MASRLCPAEKRCTHHATRPFCRAPWAAWVHARRTDSCSAVALAEAIRSRYFIVRAFCASLRTTASSFLRSIPASLMKLTQSLKHVSNEYPPCCLANRSTAACMCLRLPAPWTSSRHPTQAAFRAMAERPPTKRARSFLFAALCRLTWALRSSEAALRDSSRHPTKTACVRALSLLLAIFSKCTFAVSFRRFCSCALVSASRRSNHMRLNASNHPWNDARRKDSELVSAIRVAIRFANRCRRPVLAQVAQPPKERPIRARCWLPAICSRYLNVASFCCTARVWATRAERKSWTTSLHEATTVSSNVCECPATIRRMHFSTELWDLAARATPAHALTTTCSHARSCPVDSIPKHFSARAFNPDDACAMDTSKAPFRVSRTQAVNTMLTIVLS